MKPIIYIIFFICIFSCKKDKIEVTSKTKTDTISNQEKGFNWLLGDWKRLNETEGKQTFESWKKQPNNSYEGIGYTMLKNDTIWKEHLSITKLDKDWILQVLDPKKKDSVLFQIIDLKTNEFTAENKLHDFPKKIIYWAENKLLKAKVSNKEFAIDFEFKKI